MLSTNFYTDFNKKILCVDLNDAIERNRTPNKEQGLLCKDS